VLQNIYLKLVNRIVSLYNYNSDVQIYTYADLTELFLQCIVFIYPFLNKWVRSQCDVTIYVVWYDAQGHVSLFVGEWQLWIAIKKTNSPLVCE